MERQLRAGKALVTFLLGGAIGAGAAVLMSKVCKMRNTAAQDGTGTGSGRLATPYCDVPEGADICFPER